jgi:excisionase family DNA binding protein
MATTVRNSPSRADAASFIDAVRDDVAAGGALRLQVGDVVCEVNGHLAAGILTLLDVEGPGHGVDLAALSADLTTGQAADLLGVSRPTVVALVDSGALPASRIGTHRRIRTVDLLDYRERARTDRKAALNELVEVSDELGLYDE